MRVLIGDIGNTVTKLCLFESKNSKIKKIFYFNSVNYKNMKALKNCFKKLLREKNICNTALFSSVVKCFIRFLLITLLVTSFIETELFFSASSNGLLEKFLSDNFFTFLSDKILELVDLKDVSF